MRLKLSCSEATGKKKQCTAELMRLKERVSSSVASDSSQPHGLSMGFSRQEHWSGLSFPSPGDLPDPGIEPGSPSIQTDFSPAELPGKPQLSFINTMINKYDLECSLNTRSRTLRCLNSHMLSIITKV